MAAPEDDNQDEGMVYVFLLRNSIKRQKMNQQSARKLRREELGHESVRRQHDGTNGILRGQ